MTRFRLSILLCGLLLLGAPLALRAQSLSNTVWKAFYPPITDTLTLSFRGDTCRIRTSTGAAVLLSTFKLSHNIITFKDYGGLNKCDDLAGSYHIHQDGDKLTFEMDEDPCDARGGTLIFKGWVRVAAGTAKWTADKF